VGSWLAELDERAEQSDFPLWDNANYTGGAMRATGLASPKGEALVFEVIVYGRREGTIVRQLYTYGPGAAQQGFAGWGEELVPRGELLESVDRYTTRSKITGVTLAPEMRGGRPIGVQPVLPEGGVSPTFTVKVKGRDVTGDTDPARLAGVSVADPALLRRLSPNEVVLFHLVDAVPRDLLFSDPAELAQRAGLPDAKVLFTFDDWQHVTTEPPSESPDIPAMVDALASGRAPDRLPGRPNGNYRRYLETILSYRPADDELWGPPPSKPTGGKATKPAAKAGKAAKQAKPAAKPAKPAKAAKKTAAKKSGAKKATAKKATAKKATAKKATAKKTAPKKK
jgi:hypothetical protein